MRCLITGATGFVGRHLARCLIEQGHTVEGLARTSVFLDIPVHAVDLRDGSATAAILHAVQPQWLFHLAGFASPGQSFKQPQAAWEGNLHATQVLYDAVQQLAERPRILFVSSGLVYGDALPPHYAFTETDELRPASPYASSKAAADLLSYQMTRSAHLDIVRVRPFNHIGPGQSPEYAASSFAKQIAAMQLGFAPPILKTGDLSTQRDLTDVRDMVRAYVRLLEVGECGAVYNAGTGHTVSMRELVQRLIARAGVNVTIAEQADPTRRGDTTISKVDPARLRQATGWAPHYALDATLTDLLAYWRESL